MNPSILFLFRPYTKVQICVLLSKGVPVHTGSFVITIKRFYLVKCKGNFDIILSCLYMRRAYIVQCIKIVNFTPKDSRFIKAYDTFSLTSFLCFLKMFK